MLSIHNQVKVHTCKYLIMAMYTGRVKLKVATIQSLGEAFASIWTLLCVLEAETILINLFKTSVIE